MKKTVEPTIGEKFITDPRVKAASDSLLEYLSEYQQQITEPRPANPSLVDAYEKTIVDFGKARGGNLYFPYLGSGIGNGSLVELADGSVKYDFISGIGVHHFGHSHPSLVEASIRAGLGDTVMQGNLQQNTEAVELSQKLLKTTKGMGGGFDHCFLCSTGVMAGENALKIAFQKSAPAQRVLAFEHCFAGRTITFSQITDKPAYRKGVPLTLPVDYIPFDPKTALATLNTYLDRYPGQYAAMIFELIQGEGGFNVGSEKLFRPLMERCREAGITVLVDEVQTFARTPKLYATDHFGLGDLVDIMWIGKASQVCATFFRKDSAPAPGLLSQTFTAGTGAIAAANVIVDELVEGGYFGNKGKIQKWHNWLVKRLKKLEKEDKDWVRGPYGIGAMIAFTPFQGEPQKVTNFIKELFHEGVMGFVAGANPLKVRFLLPIGGLTDEQLEAAWLLIESALRKHR